MKAIILVGGEGTRLRPLTLNRLKSTVPMVGRPFLEYQFALLKRHGVREVALSICHKPDLIRRAFGDGRRYGLKLKYAVEKKPLGTAGAIKNAERFVSGREPVAVLNGDELSNWDFTRMLGVHRQRKALLTIGLTWVADPSSYGLVLVNARGRVQRFVEKPSLDEGKSHWVNSGLYIFSPAVFAHIPSGVNHSAERQLFPALLSAGQPIWSYASRNYWKDIGTAAKYHQAHIDILEARMGLLSIGRPWKRNQKIRVGSHCTLHPTAAISAPSVLGDHCQVGLETRVGELAVLGNRVKVGPRAILQRCVIWDDVHIGEGARLTGCVVGSGCRIGRYVQLSPGTVLGDKTIIPDYSQV